MHPHPFWGFFGQHHHHHHRPEEPFFAMGRGPRGGPPGHPGNPFGGNPFGGGRFGGGPFGGFPFFRRDGRARRGDVRAAILVLLAEESRNGYQLMQEIEKRSDGAWRPSPGSMYPALQQLEDEGLVRVEASAGGRTFHLTDKGHEQAKELQQAPAPWNTATGEGHESAMEFRSLIHQVMLAAAQVSQAGTSTQLAEARKILIDARRSLYKLLAEDAPEDAE